jgi:hypothetical protein
MNSNFSNWEVDEKDLVFDFNLKDKTKMSFSEWLWRETRSKIRSLPEISYDEIPELLE